MDEHGTGPALAVVATADTPQPLHVCPYLALHVGPYADNQRGCHSPSAGKPAQHDRYAETQVFTASLVNGARTVMNRWREEIRARP